NLNVSHAFHSPALDPILPELERAAREMRLAPPSMRLVSGLTGGWAGAEVATPGYWVRQARGAGLVAEWRAARDGGGCRHFVEIGPKPVLVGQGAAMIEDAECRWLASMTAGKADQEVLNQSAAALWVDGFPIDWRAFHPDAGPTSVRLPLYPFQE